MKIIYVAGKYTEKTHSGIDDNIKKAEYASIELLGRGWGVFTPHKNMAHYEMYEALGHFNETIWMNICIEMLSRCDALFLLDNWTKSKGSIAEFNFAEKQKIPIFYQESGYPLVDVIKGI